MMKLLKICLMVYTMLGVSVLLALSGLSGFERREEHVQGEFTETELSKTHETEVRVHESDKIFDDKFPEYSHEEGDENDSYDNRFNRSVEENLTSDNEFDEQFANLPASKNILYDSKDDCYGLEEESFILADKQSDKAAVNNDLGQDEYSFEEYSLNYSSIDRSQKLSEKAVKDKYEFLESHLDNDDYEPNVEDGNVFQNISNDEQYNDFFPKNSSEDNLLLEDFDEIDIDYDDKIVQNEFDFDILKSEEIDDPLDKQLKEVVVNDTFERVVPKDILFKAYPISGITDFQAVYATLGFDVEIHCKTENDEAAWLRHTDFVVITVGEETVITDRRIKSHYDAKNNMSVLKINEVVENDSGVYECLDNVTIGEGPMYYLNVSKPKAVMKSPAGASKVGTLISLDCFVKKSPYTTKIVWTFNSEREMNGHFIIISSETEKADGYYLESHFIIVKASLEDAGNYICEPENGVSVSVELKIVQ